MKEFDFFWEILSNFFDLSNQFSYNFWKFFVNKQKLATLDLKDFRSGNSPDSKFFKIFKVISNFPQTSSKLIFTYELNSHTFNIHAKYSHKFSMPNVACNSWMFFQCFKLLLPCKTLTFVFIGNFLTKSLIPTFFVCLKATESEMKMIDLRVLKVKVVWNFLCHWLS